VTLLAGADLCTLRLAQLVPSLLSVAIVFDLVARRYGIRAGFVSAILTALVPDLVHATLFLWAECLLAALLLAAVWLAERARDAERVTSPWIAAAALALAAAALTREMALYLTPFFLRSASRMHDRRLGVGQRSLLRSSRPASHLGRSAITSCSASPY
jgi:4-amino-4-deoxy-L-arabinose transferase-like glycosyltransferase